MRVLRWVAVFAVALALAPAPARADDAPRAPTPSEIAHALGPTRPRAAVVYDPAAERVLWGLRAGRRLPPASLMKMVTALVVAERLRPDDTVEISPRAAAAAFDRLQWRAGATFTADQVLHGMLMESSNGAAYALAERVAGSTTAFAGLANRRLARLGAGDTRLVDPSGLDAQGQYAAARDLAVVAAAVLKDPWLRAIVATRSFEVPWPDGSTATFGNINRFMWDDPTAVGVKNGYTSAAGNTVAGAATRGGRTHIVVVLGGPDVYGVADRLMALAFALAPPPPGAATEDAPAAGGTAGLPAISPIGGAPAETSSSGEAATPVASAASRATRRPQLALLGLFVILAGYVYRQRWQQLKQPAPRVAARPAAPATAVQRGREDVPGPAPGFADVEPPWSPFRRARRAPQRPIDADEWQSVRTGR